MDGLRSSRMLLLFLAPLFFLGCDLPTSSESLAEIGDGVPLAAVDCEARPEHPKCPADPGPSPGVIVDVAYAGAISGSGTAEVQTDNSSTLQLIEGQVSAAFNFANSVAGQCVSAGVFGEDGKLTYAQLLGLLTSDPESGDARVRVDKTAEESDGHRLRHGWTGAFDGRIAAWVGDPTFDRKSPAPPGASSPRVTVSGNQYTFEAGYGIVYIKQLWGRPKDHPRIICNLLDEVVVTVG